jgi:hypothetical protein
VIFTLVWIAWANGSLHHELHGHEDARARSTFLLQILVLVAMSAFIPGAGGACGAAFAVLAVNSLLAGRADRPEYRRASRLGAPAWRRAGGRPGGVPQPCTAPALLPGFRRPVTRA